MKVAFIGLGNMGSGIANCILKGGFDLTVWNRTAAKMQPLIDAGAKGAATAKEAVANADVVITSLMDDKSIIENLTSENGILAGLRPGAVHVCVTTISPDCADELDKLHRAHGSHYVSGPIVGRPDAAAAGQLTTYLAGDAEAIEKITPVCRAYTKQVTAAGDQPRQANIIKLCINYTVVSVIELIGETYCFAEKAGVDTEHLKAFFEDAAFAHPALKLYARKLHARDFAGRGGFVASGGLKDVRLMLATSEAAGAQLEIGHIVERKLAALVAQGKAETDWSALSEITRQECGLA